MSKPKGNKKLNFRSNALLDARSSMENPPTTARRVWCENSAALLYMLCSICCISCCICYAAYAKYAVSAIL